MDTLTFLNKVLPDQGVYVGAQLTSFGMRHQFFDTTDDFAQWALATSAKGGNVYYTVSSMLDPSERSQANTRVTKLVAFDVDCGPKKPYPSWREGLLALQDFVTATGLPKPMIIHSGNGLHVYWLLTDELEPHEWQPLALAMKAAAIAKDFYIDRAVPADSARLLRIVGTVNPKGGNTVKALIQAGPVTPDALRAVLGQYATATVAVASTLVQSASRQTPTSMLAQAMIVQADYPPAVASVLVDKCQQIKWATENQGDVEEPFWYALLGVAAHTENPEQTAVEWSQNHPDYSYATTIRKMDQWRSVASGPATCEKFKGERPKGCEKCKFAGKVSTPVQLGTKYAEVTVAADVLDNEAAQVPIPRPFKRTSYGIKMTVDGTDTDVCPFDIYPVGYGRDESLGYEVVRYHWNRQHMGWQELKLRQAFLTDVRRTEFATAIADQGIVLKTQKQTESFQFMLRTYMDNLRQLRSMTNLYNGMGWKDEYSQFLLGNTLFRRADDGTVSREQITLSSSHQRLGTELYRQSGTLKDWTDFTALFEKAKLNAHMFAVGLSLAAPLLKLTGLSGVTVSFCGPSGSGKTLAQLVYQSVWGDPDKLHFTAKFTPNALYNRLGFYGNLPMSIDEATMISEKEIGEFLYMVTQGRDKTRLTRTADERQTAQWALPLLLSTNIPISNKLSASSSATDAQMMRLLEFTIDKSPIFANGSAAGRKIYQFITSNYGTAGPAFLDHIMGLGVDEVKRQIKQATDTFARRYGGATFSGEERFWETTIVLVDLALRMADKLGLIGFSAHLATDWALSQTGVTRQNLVDNSLDAYDILDLYLNETTKWALTVMHTGLNTSVPLLSRMPREEVRVRYDIHRKDATSQFDHGSVTIDRTHFRKWLVAKQANYRDLLSKFREDNIHIPVNADKAYLGRGTDIKMAQSYVIRLNLSHPRLRGIFDDAGSAFESELFRQLSVIRS
jgi:hypothetical protein